MSNNSLIDILRLIILEQEGSDPKNPDVYPDQDEWGIDDAWTFSEWKTYYDANKKKYGELTAKKRFLKYWEVVEEGIGVVADNDMDKEWFKERGMWNESKGRPYTLEEFQNLDKPEKHSKPNGVSDSLVEFVKKEEYFVPCVYDDKKSVACLRKEWDKCCLKGKTPIGTATIGYGTVFYPNGIKVTSKDKNISKDIATSYLKKTLNDIANRLMKKYPKINQSQLDALTSLCYNVGFAGCTTKAPNLSAAIKKDPNPKTNPKIKPNFVDFANRKRREKEFNIYSNSNYQMT